MCLHAGEKHGRLAYLPILENWDQNNITFNMLPKIDESQKIVFEFPEKEGWLIVDIIEIAQKWSDGSLENYGLYCHSEGTKSTCVSKFVSSEGVPKKLRPFLLIEYK